MKAIHGNLRMDLKYKMTSSYYTGSIMDGGGTICDNCNLPITTVCTIEDENGKKFDVGSDCAESLISKEGRYGLEWLRAKQVLKEANRTKRYVAMLRKAKKENKLKVEGGIYWIMVKELNSEHNTWRMRLGGGSEAVKIYEKELLNNK